MSEHRLQPAHRAPTALSETQLAYATWATITTPCDEAAHHLVDKYGAVEALQRAQHWAANPTSAGTYETAVARWAAKLRHLDATSAPLTYQAVSSEIITPIDPTWPIGLADLGLREPFALWVQGNGQALLHDPHNSAIAIVGARSCTAGGAQIAGQLAHELAAGGHPILSGGGAGIDAAAHRGALTTTTGTIAVLAGGLDRPYPAAHRELFREIAVSGLLVSEAPPSIRPSRAALLHRMRLIAALGAAVVIVQSPARGGALAAAAEAEALGRPVGAIPGAVSDMAHAGCLHLIHAGKAHLVRDAHDICALLTQPSPPAPPPGFLHGLHPTLATVLAAVPTARARPAARITAITGFDAHQTARALGELQARDLVARTAHGWRRMAR